ncbi:putative glycoside hydrolase [Paraglaciecola sp.]|uniref:putative glycoside hydrolase n=1 Tax=Paraglaciecola sp. TaxID=1920173 RepID=UPI003EF40061
MFFELFKGKRLHFFKVVNLIFISICVFVSFQTAANSQATNPKYSYFIDGEPVGSWKVVLSDENNWMLPVPEKEGASAGNRLKMSRAEYKGPDNAVALKWGRKKGKSSFSLYGTAIDLSQFAARGALTMEIKIKKKPKGAVTVGMDCGYPCRGELSIHKTLRKLPINEWTTYPIPINCFASMGLDLSKINAIFMLSTDKPFEAQVANIRLELLPEGSPTCAK